MSEENGKKPAHKRKRMLNLIDVILIVLVVLALGVVLSYRFFVAGDNTSTVQLSYEIEVVCVSENVNFEELISDSLYSEDGICFGTVSACSKVEVKKHQTVSEAKVLFEKNVYCMTATVSCEATRTKDGRYLIDGVELALGDAVSLHSNDFVVNGTCIQITEVTE